MESITEFIKIFCEKVWFWLIVSVFGLLALCSEEIFTWLGFEKNNRWIVGIIAILALSLSIQHICDWVKEYMRRRSIIKNIDYLTDSALEELKNIVNKRKKTLKIKDNNNIEQRRIVTHFNRERHDNYVTFPDFLWKELEKRFVTETDKYPIICNTNNKNLAQKIFCSQITWWFVVIFVIAINPGEKLKSYIPSDWYLWFMLIFAAFLVWVIFKASHNCKKTSIEDIVYMGAIYSLGLFVCMSSPISNSYPEKDIQRLFDCLTSLGPLIVGFAAAFFACTQWRVTEKQHNLALLEKRLSVTKKLETLIKDKVDKSMEQRPNPQFLEGIYAELKNIAGESFILFNKNISENIMDLANKIKELKTSIQYNEAKNQGKSLIWFEQINKTFEKDMFKIYGVIVHNSNELIADMHLIMREGKI